MEKKGGMKKGGRFIYGMSYIATDLKINMSPYSFWPIGSVVSTASAGVGQLSVSGHANFLQYARLGAA